MCLTIILDQYLSIDVLFFFVFIFLEHAQSKQPHNMTLKKVLQKSVLLFPPLGTLYFYLYFSSYFLGGITNSGWGQLDTMGELTQQV